ncbi:16268_t:CDS:1 [Cetraspora pellucida]|uniref:Queuosine 5'-phosphate N-glycosylase/hydrolase n=1 Tax=Cetraspora pellucida TaxID=1433469 RepID=A0A9N9NZM5_9GLOM|nr:16268_t:CDS:1 [Cetraspora pellucida]
MYQTDSSSFKLGLNPVLKSAYFISKNSQDVQIPLDGIYQASSKIYNLMKIKKYSTSNWKKHDLHPKTTDEKTIDWIFLVDLLNFSFWSDLDKATDTSNNQKFSITFKNHQYTGYWALCAAINRSIEEGTPITTPSLYASENVLSDQAIHHIFRSSLPNTQIPLLKERIRCIREAGKVLTTKFDGSFINCIKVSNKSCLNLLKIIIDNFPCFRDEIMFLGERVCFYKRAQILIADIWACFEGKGYGEFKDIDEITMFADYRVPQALHYLSAIKYSDNLMKTLERCELLEYGSRLEVEIRGCSIWAVELLKREIMRMIEQENEQNVLPVVNAIILDFFIWDFAKEHINELEVEFHRTRSIYY